MIRHTLRNLKVAKCSNCIDVRVDLGQPICSRHGDWSRVCAVYESGGAVIRHTLRNLKVAKCSNCIDIRVDLGQPICSRRGDWSRVCAVYESAVHALIEVSGNCRKQFLFCRLLCLAISASLAAVESRR